MVRLLGLEQASAVLGSGSYDNMPSGALSLEKLEEQGTNVTYHYHQWQVIMTRLHEGCHDPPFPMYMYIYILP